ncbi:MAG: hypothetical protein ACI4EN_10485 [Butyrivibrio sp.]
MKKYISVFLTTVIMCLYLAGCRQAVHYEFKFVGRVESVEDNVLTIRSVGDYEYHIDPLSSSMPYRNMAYWYLPEDEYFMAGEEYIYECCGDKYSTLEYEIDSEWLEKNSLEDFVEEAVYKVCEFTVENGIIKDMIITSVPVEYIREYPVGIIGEAFPGEMCGYGSAQMGTPKLIDWFFINRIQATDEITDGELQNTEDVVSIYGWELSEYRSYMDLQITGINECRVYWLEEWEAGTTRIWVDTPDEDLIIKVGRDLEVYSYPGGVYLDADGEIRNHHSDIAESRYKITDYSFYLYEVEATVIN